MGILLSNSSSSDWSPSSLERMRLSAAPTRPAPSLSSSGLFSGLSPVGYLWISSD